MFSKIIDIIVAIYTFPVKTWQGGCSDGSEQVESVIWGSNCETGYYREPDIGLGAFAGFIIYGVTLLVLVLITTWVWGEIQWRRNRQKCQHCNEWTVEVGDGKYPSCLDGHACCDDCYEGHIDQAVEHRAETEPRIQCPHCGQQMDKTVQHRTILDVCTCGAVFLSPEEFNHLQDLASERGYDDGYSDGKSAGSTNGLLVGMMIGNSFD